MKEGEGDGGTFLLSGARVCLGGIYPSDICGLERFVKNTQDAHTEHVLTHIHTKQRKTNKQNLEAATTGASSTP